MDIWNDPEVEKLRDSRRERSGRIAYDCLNLKVREDRAVCAKGHCLGQAEDKTYNLTYILKGITPGICKSCQDFDSMEAE